jgi:hypothetical protein
VHRFTEDMQRRRVRSWKDLCEQHMKRLVAVMAGRADPGPPVSREDRKLMDKGLSPEGLLLAQQSSFELNAGMEGGGGGGLASGGTMSFMIPSEDGDGDGEGEGGGPASPAAVSAVSPSRSRSRGQGEEPAGSFDAAGDGEGEGGGLVTQHLDAFEAAAPRGQVSEMTAHWLTTAMVGRLARATPIADGRGAPPMLGPRSYFEESYADTVRANVLADDLRVERRRARAEELRVNPRLAEEEAAQKQHASRAAGSLSALAGKDKGSVYYVAAGREEIHAMRPEDMRRTIGERKEFFYKMLRRKVPGEEGDGGTGAGRGPAASRPASRLGSAQPEP